MYLSLVDTPSLPSKSLLTAQAEWLAPARARLLRRIGIARRRRILDLGAGYGAVTGELVRRGGGFVAALDRVDTSASLVTTAPFLCGDALSLPFADSSFDLIFCQCVLMWVTQAVPVASEIYRVLEPGGVFVALEPDYAGMIEYPPEIATKDIWVSALARVGAKPRLGRMLPRLLTAAGFAVRVDLLERLSAPSQLRFDFLRTLPLLPEEKISLDQAWRMADNLDGSWEQVVYLPFFLMTATKS
ncbi:MAG: hypothetical protein CSA11_11740 [Chloroflexi bacterium]|nr:MAG: hypothetical protein CSA11_11740 [Chloroflexota bacterium]